MIPLPEINLGGILPALVLCIAGLVAMVACLFVRAGAVRVAGLICLAGVVVAFAANGPIRGMDEKAFSGLMDLNAFTWFLNIVILIAAGLTILMSIRYLEDEGLETYEYFVLLAFASAGLMFMAAGDHLLLIFVGLETLSISIYVLAGILPENPRSRESSLKYLLLGAFASGIFLYGAALLYGAAGSLMIPDLAKKFASGSMTPLAMAGMGLLVVGFGFKIAAAPFHMWTPDVYEGAPSPITGFMSVAVKAAAFAAFIRVLFVGLPAMQMSWVQMLWVLAVITMIVGNVVAVVQDNIKRMLAYSSIAHAGYILMGVIAGGEDGGSGVLYYLLAYTLTNMGAFGVVTLVGRQGEANVMIDDYRGLGKSNPALAIAMSIFLFSLAGIPPTAGFVGKFAIFYAAVSKGFIWLAVIGVLTSAVSVYYYFRVVMKMYMEAPEAEPATLQFGAGMTVALAIAVVGVVYLGIFPNTYLDLATESIKPLFAAVSS